MYHPLYYQATRYMGRPVYVHHMNGRTYHGTITGVNPGGIYVVQHPPGTNLTAANAEQFSCDHALHDGDLALDLVYSPGAYFGFGALTGLTLGAMAGGLWW